MSCKYFDSIKNKESVAIVGSSDSILKNSFGKRIDSFSEVIRFNRSITKGYKKYVGSKTTTRVLNNAVFCCCASLNKNWTLDKNFAKKIKGKKIVVIAPWRIKNNLKIKNIKKKNRYFFYDSLLLNKFIFVYFFKYFKIFILLFKILILNKNGFLSLGTFFILLCVINKICPTIFGFNLKESMKKRSHYWEDIKNIKTSSTHIFSEEKKILLYLHNLGLIKLIQ